jgi:hypothetical protein
MVTNRKIKNDAELSGISLPGKYQTFNLLFYPHINMFNVGIFNLFFIDLEIILQ